MRLWLVLEVSLVPNGAFEEEQRVALRVPITRDLDGSRLGKVVLHEFVAGVRLLVLEIAVATGLHAEVVITVVVGVNNDVPVAVEAYLRPHIGGREVRRRNLRRHSKRREYGKHDSGELQFAVH